MNPINTHSHHLLHSSPVDEIPSSAFLPAFKSALRAVLSSFQPQKLGVAAAALTSLMASPASAALLYTDVPVNSPGSTVSIGTVGNSKNVTFGPDGSVYVIYRDSVAGVMVAKSSNRGQSFNAPTVVTSASAGTEMEIKVGPEGNVYVTYKVGSNLMFARSINGGASFETPTLVATVGNANLHFTAGSTGIFIVNSSSEGRVYRNLNQGAGPFTAATYATSVFADVFVAPDGEVIVGWDNPTVYVNRSTDNGATFSASVPTGGSAFYSTMDVCFTPTQRYLYTGGANGSSSTRYDLITGALVTMPTTRINSAANLRQIASDNNGNVISLFQLTTGGQLSYEVSTDHGVTFGAPVAISPTATSANVAMNAATGDMTVIFQAGGNLFATTANGELAAAPEIAVTEGGSPVIDNGSLDFGTTSVGSPVTKTFTITNSGTAALTLAGLSVSAGFSIAQDFGSTTVAANGGTTTFQIRMEAGAVGTPSGNLTFTSNDGDESPFDLQLSGTISGAPVIDPEVVITDKWLDILNNLPIEGRILRPMPGVINKDGYTTFSATGKIGTGGLTQGNDSLLLTNVTGTLRVIGQEGMTLPDGSAVPGAFSDLILTAGGQTAASERFSGATAATDYGYLISENGNNLELLSREGDAATGGGVFIGHTGRHAADDNERIYFPGNLSGVAATKNSGVWYDEAGDIKILAKEGNDVSLVTGDAAWLGNFTAPLSAAGDGAAFIAALQNNPDNAAQKTALAKNVGLFSGPADSLELVARKGDDVTGAGKITSISGVSRNSDGDHAFISLLALSSTAPVVVAANDQVLMAEIGGVKHLVAREGITNLTGTLKPDRFGSFHMTSADEVIYQVWLVGTGVTTANDSALVRWSVAGGNVVLAREGSLATGTGLNYVTFQSLSVSPGGAIVLQSTLNSKSSSVLMRALPGAALSVAVMTGSSIPFKSGTSRILALDIYQTNAGTGGGGGGFGSAINDAGAIFTVLAVGNNQHAARVFTP